MQPNSKKPVTIKSIANELGISFSTVSKALNGNPNIKKETKDLVIAKAQEMNYMPNTFARGLRGESSKTIAVIFNDIENSVLTFIFRTISVEMARHGYTTMIFDSRFDKETERRNIQTVLSRQVDFIILEPVTDDKENLDLLNGMEQQLILYGSQHQSIACHQVHVNHVLGGYLSAKEMLENAHFDNLILVPPLSFPISNMFVTGVKQAYSEFGIPFDERALVFVESTITSSFLYLQQLWDMDKQKYSVPFSGVITFDDHTSYGVYKSAFLHGLKIPKDISVIGYDDNTLTEFSAPPLTTIHLPKERMAQCFIDILQSVLLYNNKSKHVYSLEPSLIRRSSVRNLNADK